MKRMKYHMKFISLITQITFLAFSLHFFPPYTCFSTLLLFSCGFTHEFVPSVFHWFLPSIIRLLVEEYFPNPVFIKKQNMLILKKWIVTCIKESFDITNECISFVLWLRLSFRHPEMINQDYEECGISPSIN